MLDVYMLLEGMLDVCLLPKGILDACMLLEGILAGMPARGLVSKSLLGQGSPGLLA